MTAPTPDSSGTRCPVDGKVRYYTRAQAKKAANRNRKRFGRMDTYPCGEFWHIGHLPRGVIAGAFDRSRINRPVSTDTR